MAAVADRRQAPARLPAAAGDAHGAVEVGGRIEVVQVESQQKVRTMG
jgi:hypothetical protein